MQSKSIAAATSTAGVGVQRSISIGPDPAIRRAVNYHNLWWSAAIEPENADANANGTWVLWTKRDITAADITWSIANLDSETSINMVIACGVWQASNQTPFNFSSQLKSSRNLLPNELIVLSVRVEGISAGNARILELICSHLTVK